MGYIALWLYVCCALVMYTMLRISVEEDWFEDLDEIPAGVVHVAAVLLTLLSPILVTGIALWMIGESMGMGPVENEEEMLCANCGHLENDHDDYSCDGRCMPLDSDGLPVACLCQKFTRAGQPT